MRNYFLVGLVSLFLTAHINAAAHEMPLDEMENKDHRYEIFIAEHNGIISGKSIVMKSIFKIDLETGTVWRYRQGVDSKGKPFEEFFEVPNQ